MLNTILNISAILFDMFTIMLYFNHVLKERVESISLPFYWIGFILMELILELNMFISSGNYSLFKALITLSVSTITTFALTFFYHANLRHRIFVATSFQVYACLGEFEFATILSYLNPSIFEIPGLLQETIITFGAKIITFLLVCITNIIFNHKSKPITFKYSLLLLLTPIVSLTVMVSFPANALTNMDYGKYSLIAFAGLLLLNIVNYYLLESVLESYDLNEKLKTIGAQLLYQSEKYQQLSAAYRSTRSIVHDTKKHMFYIQSCVDNREYDKIVGSINTLITDLESKYIKINTGNLVIDTFVGNHMTLAERENIKFTTSIKVVIDDIPVEDYDLCIILGNLLDNSLQACKKIENPEERIIFVQIATTEKFFVIHIVNPLVPKELLQDTKSALFHGYGIENVKRLTDKYQGTYTCIEEDTYDTSVIIPILRDSQGYRLGSLKPENMTTI